MHGVMARFFLEVCKRKYFAIDEIDENSVAAYYTDALKPLVYHQIRAHTEGEMTFLKHSLRNIYYIRECVVAGQLGPLVAFYEEAMAGVYRYQR